MTRTKNYFVFAFIFFSLLGISTSILCHTCLGRDMTNCMDESHQLRARCNGFCFKLIDTDHNIIAKGCSTGEHDTEREIAGFKPGVHDEHVKHVVTLPWDKDEELIGDTVFCNSKDFCNSSSKATISLVALSLVALFHAAMKLF